MDKEFIYIVQGSAEFAKCKIGITNNLERRYNSSTGISKDNIFEYLFAAAVCNGREIENDLKLNFSYLREIQSREIYFYNASLLDMYVDFIKGHKNFVQEVQLPKSAQNKAKIIKKYTPSLQEREMSQADMLNKAKKVKNDEFYTRYEDIEKEIACRVRF